MNFNSRISILEGNIQPFDEITANNVFKFLRLGPMIETEDLVM